MTDDMQIMGELDHQADFAMPKAPPGSKVYSSDRKVYLRFNDAVQRKAQEIGAPEPDQPEMTDEELMERIERFKNPKTTDALVQMARTTAPEPVVNTSPEAMLLNKNNEVNNAYKIYELFEGEPFDGLPEDAIDYALDAMGEFSFNFLGPVSFAESGFDAGGTLAQAAHIISAQDPEKAKAFVDFMAEYERLPTWSYEGVGRAFRGIFSDPTTYATAGAGYFLSKAGTQITATGIKRAIQELAKRPMTLAAGEGAVYAGGGEEALMGVEEASGREISGLEKGLRRGISTTIGAAAGPTLMKGMQAGGQVIGEIAEAVGKPTMQAVGNVIEEAGEAAQARIDEPGEKLGMGVDIDPLIAGAGDAVAKFRAPTEKQPGVIAFHGSGADFDEFKLEYIGTGEGAQAYGYGLYFTDSEDIAKFYRDTIASRDAMHGQLPIRYKGKKFAEFEDSAAAEAEPDKYRMLTTLGKEIHRLSYSPKLRTPENAKKQLLARLENEIAQQRNLFKNESADVKDAMEEAFIASLQRDVDALEQINPADVTIEKTGKMYKVGLEPKPEDMLDYQATFADQPKNVQDALKAIGYEVETNRVGQKNSKAEIDVAMKRPMPVILDNLKKMFESENWQNELYGRGDRIISEKLLEQGVPGIKYRAAGSRAASVDAADAEMNYVIFDDKMIKILEKYGIVGPVAITGIAASQQEGESANVDT